MPEQMAQAQVTDRFVECSRELNRLLSTMGGDATWYCKSFNPYPFLISKPEHDLHASIQRGLHQAIKNMVEMYVHDSRLQNIVAQPEDGIQLFNSFQNVPYSIGSYRPDFLHDVDGTIKVCEINARFPCNGYFITHYLGRAFESVAMHSHLRCAEKLKDVPATFLNRFDRASRVTIAKGREKGWDIHFLLHELKEAGYSYELIDGSSLVGRNDIFGLVSELHQDELWQEGILKAVIASRKVPQLNDPRTILFAHDKRLLSIFQDDEIIGDYVDEQTMLLLQKHVIPTFVIAQSPEKVEEAKSNRNDWVLKPNLLGKGEQLLIGKNTSDEEWQSALSDENNAQFVLQPFIQQKKFPIQMLVDNSVQNLDLNVVGTLLCFDDNFLGTGIYRASPKDIVNVAGGGAILFPMLNESHD